VSGADLTVTKLEIGTIVTALINKTGVPGAATYFSLLVPEVNLNGQSVTIQTIGCLTNTREVSNIGPGQRETYAEVALFGTAGNVATPL